MASTTIPWTDGTWQTPPRALRTLGKHLLRASANGGPWRMLRVASLRPATTAQAGPFLCAPKRAGLEVTFTRWARTERDADLHTDPPRPELE